jgi:hypothetical protein
MSDTQTVLVYPESFGEIFAVLANMPIKLKAEGKKLKAGFLLSAFCF